MTVPSSSSLSRALLALLALLPLALACPAPPSEDGGSADAGDVDGGAVDSGAADGGSSDGGAVDDDAGLPDAGEDPCAAAIYDADLGTLALGDGFSVVESAPLPGGAFAVATTIGLNDEIHVAALDSVSEAVVDLGAWPTLGGSEPLFDAVPAVEASEERYLSSFLAAGGARIAAGYTLPFDVNSFVSPGTVALHDGAATSYADAEGNYSAAFYGDALLVNGTSAGAATLYALRPGASGLEQSEVATFPAEWAAFSGYTAVVRDQIVVVGGYYAATGEAPTNHLLAVPASHIDAALAGGVPVDLTSGVDIAAHGMGAVSAFGDGVAVLKGDFGLTPEGVVRVGLSLDGGDQVSAAAPTFVLRTVDECTSIDLLASLGDDLLVGVLDPNGRRLVRVRVGG